MDLITYKLEDIVAEFVRQQAVEIIELLHGFLSQFNITVEVEIEDGEEPMIDWDALNEYLKKESE